MSIHIKIMNLKAPVLDKNYYIMSQRIHNKVQL